MNSRRLWFRAGIPIFVAVLAASGCVFLATSAGEQRLAAAEKKAKKKRPSPSPSTNQESQDPPEPSPNPKPKPNPDPNPDPNPNPNPGPNTRPSYTVLAYPDIGMHMMTQDFSEMCILPPYSTMRAQVVRRSTGDDPQIVTQGVSVNFSIPGNTASSTKTNFWDFSDKLFPTLPHLLPDVGLTGSTLAGPMIPESGGDWALTAVPATPLTDKFQVDTTQLASVVVRDGTGSVLASTKAVIPVSWTVQCDLCHNTPGISVATDILRKHDVKYGTTLEQQKPVLCSNCHADTFLGKRGVQNVKALSHSIHSSHASLVSSLTNLKNKCVACHPPTQPRDPHKTAGMSCADCHGDMNALGATTRHPWVDEPTCASCHSKINPAFSYEEPGKLFKDSRGHGGVHCAACHGPQHAVGVSTNAADNAQAILQQGKAGTISDCTVCHAQKPSDPFPHRRDD